MSGSPAIRRSLLWLAAAGIAVMILIARLEVSFDLSAFLPEQTSLAQEVLIEQARSGPASRLLVIGIAGAPENELIQTSSQLRQSLADRPEIVTVLNGEFPEEMSSVPEPVNSYYLLMRDIDFSQEALRADLQNRLRDLAFGGGSAMLGLMSRDPMLVTLDILESLSPADMNGEPWIAGNGSAVLMAETAAAATDIAAQAQAIEVVRRAFSELPDSGTLALEITGVGAFSVELQNTIRAEATLRSVFASAALLLVLFVVFRSPRLLLVSALPLLAGFLGGLTLVALLFEKVHGITLAFGFTLLGIAIDYPLHLFSHAQRGSGLSAIGRIWPTMRLGVASTVIAYLALALSNSEGLAQLGVFTAGGVIIASLATRAWIPHLLAESPDNLQRTGETAVAPRLRYLATVALLLMAIAAVYPRAVTGLWDDNLSSLSPVASDRLAADRVLRSAAATPDLRYQLVLYADSLQALLVDSERADTVLAEAVDNDLLENWQSVSLIMPSADTHSQRQSRIPDAQTLAERLRLVVAETAFRADAFDPFLARASAAISLPPLSIDDLRSSPLRSWLDAHVMQLGDSWVALVSLVGPRPEQLSAHIRESGIAAELVDFQSASRELMRDYRTAALQTIFVAAILIICLLWWAHGQFRQTLWIGLTVVTSLTVTIATIILVHGSLTVIHLVALLLVLGLGLDYALFLSRTEPSAERRATDRGVVACAASTTLAFAILAGSSIPVLKFLGLTVAAGSLASFVIAYVGSRVPRVQAN
jgi:predicted exporter